MDELKKHYDNFISILVDIIIHLEINNNSLYVYLINNLDNSL